MKKTILLAFILAWPFMHCSASEYSIIEGQEGVTCIEYNDNAKCFDKEVYRNLLHKELPFMLAPLLYRPSEAVEDVLIMGLGAGQVANIYSAMLPQSRLTVWNSNPSLTRINMDLGFNLPRGKFSSGEQYHTYLELTANHNPIKYDFVINNQVLEPTNGALKTVDTLKVVRSIMKPSGVYLARLNRESPLLNEEIASIASVFDGVRRTFNKEGDVVVIGTKGGVPVEYIQRVSSIRAPVFYATLGVNVNVILAGLDDELKLDGASPIYDLEDLTKLITAKLKQEKAEKESGLTSYLLLFILILAVCIFIFIKQKR